MQITVTINKEIFQAVIQSNHKHVIIQLLSIALILNILNINDPEFNGV